VVSLGSTGGRPAPPYLECAAGRAGTAGPGGREGYPDDVGRRDDRRIPECEVGENSLGLIRHGLGVVPQVEMESKVEAKL